MRNPDFLAVHSIDHFTLEVPDVAAAEHFYSAFGLDVRRTEEGLAIATADSPHVWASVQRGPRKRLAGITFGIHATDLPRFAERLGQRPNAGVLHLRSPDGLPIQLTVAEKTTLDQKGSFAAAPVSQGPRGAGPRSAATIVRPRRLAHLSLFTADVQRSIDFYEEMLGLRLSDRSGGDVAFLHAPHGSDHHLIALARSSGGGLHHCSWDVGTLAEVGLGAAQMARAGYEAGWGMGRHVLGSNYFHYVRDPWGSWSEYSADMDYIPADITWEARDHPGEDSFYLWGPQPPSDFVDNHEAERTT